ncbi:transferrin-like isoform X2 [Anticarsia gemmatalis]|uniref:transferrin-like isoform X2 n=1 Tax=Anticarsia gemmatalis TaxID=129554 RepID=UPI003F7774F3
MVKASYLFIVAIYLGLASAQTFRVCVPPSVPKSVCEGLAKDNSNAVCQEATSSLECALKMSTFQSDISYFSPEETILFGFHQPNWFRVVATVRDTAKLDPYSFEAVAVVPVGHTDGFEGLRGGVYCHPGFDQADVKWSPRVRKTLENLAARTDHCEVNTDTTGKTSEEIEIDTLSQFFSAGCRPGTWSYSDAEDADLKNRYSNLCSRCGPNSDCSRYTIDMGSSVSGVNNDIRHIQALECLRTNSQNTPAVAYVAWDYVREYFTLRNPQQASSFAVLCSNGLTVPLNATNLADSISPCALVRQPWATIIASPNVASNVLNNMRTWWPNGSKPSGDTWQANLFTALTGGTSSAQVVFENFPVFPINYTRGIRVIPERRETCITPRNWCTTSADELVKCFWVRQASHILGLQPPITCVRKNNVFECLNDIRNSNAADFMSLDSNYGYLARVLYGLGPVKLVQNAAADTAKIAAFVKESAIGTISNFEQLRGKKACFPEFGGLANMAFVRTGQEVGVLSTAQCDYARAIGEFFSGGCAPGATDSSHAIGANSTFDASVLCSTCKYTTTPASNQVCSFDDINLYVGNKGAVACLADAENDVAFLDIRDISSNLAAAGLQANQIRALCRNNQLAATAGINVDNSCLLAHVVDAEVVTRRSDPMLTAVRGLLEKLDAFFGYTAANQLINLEIFSPFNTKSDLLFKDSAIGFTDPSPVSAHEPAKNYMELFDHLDKCTYSASGATAVHQRA